MGKRNSQRGRSEFFDYVPLKAQMTLYLAVFFIFSVMGFLFDLAGAGGRFTKVILWAVLGGLVATFWAAAFIRRWNLALFAAIMVPTSFFAFWWARPPLRFDPHAVWSAVTAFAVVVTGYVLFVKFIRGQALTTLRLMTEMSLAQQIHASLTKPVQLRTARFEAFGRSDAGSEMGGDILDVVERPGRLDLFLGDVSGHGVRAGVVMGMVKSAIRMKLRSSSALDDLLKDLNGVVGELANPGMFVTLAALQLDESDSARAVLAGHLPILHYRSAERDWREIEAEHPPLGVVSEEQFSVHEVRFAAGDLFVVPTDGLTEIFDRAEAQLGWQGFRQVLADCSPDLPLAEICDRIFSAARAFGPQSDDQSVLLVRVL